MKVEKCPSLQSHYLRLGAAQKVAQFLPEIVHRVSPLVGDELDLTCTPGNLSELGGNVRERKAQHKGKTRFPLAGAWLTG